MMTITHAIIGATTGNYVSSIPLIIVLSILFHLGLDKIPHFLPKEINKLYTIVAIDTIITFLFLLSLLSLESAHKTTVLVGALTQVGIDLFMVLTPLIKTKLGKWHVARQNHRTEPYYYAIDLTITGLLLLLWWATK